ncbi:hypothetical protein K502DRAFT_294996 [Neoconidiobolus thromboides FSU 785]|nr:hypothetical protein K502DRAFT_294996 [Neoconidiobolus thromboides FSU 785]
MADNIVNNSLATISLTHVQYNHQDIIGKLLAYLTLSPLAILVAYVSIAISRREFAVMLMFLGQLINEGVNFVLKRIIKENRPTDFLGKGHGMPSSHAMFVGYTCIVYLNYHTQKQVIIGYIIGNLFGILWDIIVEKVIRTSSFFDNIQQFEICQSFYIRDSRDSDNIWKMEYESITKNKSKRQ